MSDKKIYTSMRGVKVDVDLIKIKSNLSTVEKNKTVINRENYLINKRKRISKKRLQEMFDNQVSAHTAIQDNAKLKNEDLQIENEVNKTLPETKQEAPSKIIKRKQ